MGNTHTMFEHENEAELRSRIEQNLAKIGSLIATGGLTDRDQQIIEELAKINRGIGGTHIKTRPRRNPEETQKTIEIPESQHIRLSRRPQTKHGLNYKRREIEQDGIDPDISSTHPSLGSPTVARPLIGLKSQTQRGPVGIDNPEENLEKLLNYNRRKIEKKKKNSWFWRLFGPIT